MQAIHKAAITATLLLGAVAAHATSLTYDFTGTMLDGYGFDGQAVTGSLTVDTGLYSHTAGDGVTWQQAYGENSAGLGLIHATMSLSGGFSMALGGQARFPTAETYVYKNHAGMDEFIVDGGSETGTNATGFLQLRTSDLVGDPSLIFPDAAPGDLSVDQRVRFDTPDSFDIGYFELGDATGDLLDGRFLITSVSGSGVATPVPEPGSTALMLAGLLGIGLSTVRRRASARRSIA